MSAPIIKILSIIKRRKEDSSIVFELNEEFILFYEKETGRKKISNGEINNYVLELLSRFFFAE